MESIVIKHIGQFVRYMMVRQLGVGRGNVVIFLFFLLLYVVIFNTCCVIIVALRTEFN